MEVLSIKLEVDGLVLRSREDTSNDATLAGLVVLHLKEEATVKEIQLLFVGTAKVAWRDSSSHSYEHPLFSNEFSFLNPTLATKAHSQTLSVGIHHFPFSIIVPGSLPASLRTYTGSCVIEYKLKAVVSRPGFAADWKARKIIRITRGFGENAVEFNQTLEIENTWPGKVMYSFVIPHKAYVVGDAIPVSVKFSPIAKGVKIISLVTTIREHAIVHSKSSSHSESRDTAVTKYSFIQDGEGSAPNTSPPSRVASSVSLASLNHGSGASTPANGDFFHSPSQPLVASGSAQGVAAPARVEQPIVDDGVDVEIDVVVDVDIPPWTTPSHSVHPIFITHKIKWSAFIKNPDGHVSELRCALPICVLDATLAEESRLASSGSRNLLFGESGALAVSTIPQVDLPSYQDHTMDRVANAETSSYFSHSSFLPTARSRVSTPGTPALYTPSASPPLSRNPSRPASPSNGHPSTSHSSSSSTPLGTPNSPPAIGGDEQDHRNWIDSELMGTLNLEHTPPGSNSSSRHNSRPSSRANSRPSSRPSSPDHSQSIPAPLSSSWSTSNAFDEPPPTRPPTTRSASSSFFHLHIPKPLRPLTAFSRTASSSNLNSAVPPSALSAALASHAAKSHGRTQSSDANIIHTHSIMSNSPTISGSPISGSPIVSTTFMTNYPGISTALAASETPGTPEDISEEVEEDLDGIDFLSQVPSYDIARRGFLGGGVTPLSTTAPPYQ